jgi:serine phosphatase RsbU (regulator of sigma subunit)
MHVALGVLPFLVMAAVAAIDVLAGPGIGFLPLLSLGPALAAVSLRPAPTALTGALAMLLCAVLATYDDLTDSHRGLIALSTIAGVTAAGAVASAGRHRRERDLADISAVAEAAQRVLLRPVPEQIGPVGLAVRYMSAATSARIGGDLYEVITADGKVRLIIGDVQGKGLAAVQTAAAVLGAFREAAHDAADLAALAARIELSLQRQATEEEFVTAILAQIASDGSVMELMNCGHPPPLLLSGAGAAFAEPRSVGLPFGLGGLAPAGRSVEPVTLGPGDRMLFYTDGISEARDKTGAFYQLDHCSALLRGSEPGRALDLLCDDVIRHVGHKLRDDAAVLLVTRNPPGLKSGTGQAGADGLPRAGVP